jgi:hypothetical protein
VFFEIRGNGSECGIGLLLYTLIYNFFIVYLETFEHCIINFITVYFVWTPPPSDKKATTNGLNKLRLKGGKDFKKSGEGPRGKNVIEAYRVKDKDMKRTTK